MLALYRTLLRLYPLDYFREYASEMSWVFAQANNAARERTIVHRLPFYAREIAGVITGAARQRFFGANWNSMRRVDMEFRFPRSTVFLMWVILGGVLLTIAEAKIIAAHYGAPEAESVWSMLPWFIVETAVFLFAVGAAAWGILYALRRTGVQRLENLDTSSNE